MTEIVQNLKKKNIYKIDNVLEHTKMNRTKITK